MTRSLVLLFAIVPLLAQNPVTDAVKSAYDRMKQNLIETAEAMPESDYGYRLTAQQRPFGEWMKHTAMGNYGLCSAMRGVPVPETVHSIEGLNVKADIQTALKESFAYCDTVLSEMTDQKATSQITNNDRKIYPAQPMISLVASLNEHYGNLVGYLRSKGIVPPSTARSLRKK